MTSRSSGSNNHDDDDDEEDLDTFLTTMESKLRGPFSSLDLAKAVTTNALRGSHTPVQYLQNVSKVLSRTDKVIQVRVLIGLLGLDANDAETNQEIHHILQQAQQAPTHEEWVRTIAGLIQGIMFETPEAAAESSSSSSGNNTDGAPHRSCRGPEASNLLDELCEEVCSNVQSAQEVSTDPEAPKCPDLNASFIPYRYSLLPHTFLKVLVPECTETSYNPHFQVNTQASILQVDEQLEAQRAKEELEHQGPILMKTKMSGTTIHGSKANGAAKAATALPPGFRPTKLVQTPAQKAAAAAKASSGSSMFMPKKTNPLLVQRQQQVQQKTLLRRKGAAQSLVNKTKVKNRVPGAVIGTAGPTMAAAVSATNTATATTAAAQVRATAGKFGRAGGAAMAGRSKMKMIDVQEVNNLTKEHAARDAVETTGRMSKKRRIMEAAAAAKKAKMEATPANSSITAVTSTTSNNGEAASPQEPQQAVDQTLSVAQLAQTNNASSVSQEEGWKVLLKERSNKLSDEDRQRVQQFFQHRQNPTPEQSVVKMKLHEQRSQDPETGQEIKETFYLELDYSNFSSKQSRKVKRY